MSNPISTLKTLDKVHAHVRQENLTPFLSNQECDDCGKKIDFNNNEDWLTYFDTNRCTDCYQKLMIALGKDDRDIEEEF